MTDMATFDFEQHKLRTVFINGEPWFVAKDVCAVLGYCWGGKKTVLHVPDEWRGVGSVPTPTGNQELVILSEQGLYFSRKGSGNSGHPLEPRR